MKRFLEKPATKQLIMLSLEFGIPYDLANTLNNPLGKEFYYFFSVQTISTLLFATYKSGANYFVLMNVFVNVTFLMLQVL